MGESFKAPYYTLQDLCITYIYLFNYTSKYCFSLTWDIKYKGVLFFCKLLLWCNVIVNLFSFPFKNHSKVWVVWLTSGFFYVFLLHLDSKGFRVNIVEYARCDIRGLSALILIWGLSEFLILRFCRSIDSSSCLCMSYTGWPERSLVKKLPAHVHLIYVPRKFISITCCKLFMCLNFELYYFVCFFLNAFLGLKLDV